jgi:hypothetical protein
LRGDSASSYLFAVILFGIPSEDLLVPAHIHHRRRRSGGPFGPAASIWKVSLSPGTNAAYSDAEGRFKIDSVTPGRYRITPTLDGFVYAKPARLKAVRDAGVWVQAAGGSPVKGVQLRMTKPGVIGGRALLPNGEAITGISAGIHVLSFRFDDYGQRILTDVPGVPLARPDDRG